MRLILTTYHYCLLVQAYKEEAETCREKIMKLQSAVLQLNTSHITASGENSQSIEMCYEDNELVES
jgi:hypothetical protein